MTVRRYCKIVFILYLTFTTLNGETFKYLNHETNKKKKKISIMNKISIIYIIIILSITEHYDTLFILNGSIFYAKYYVYNMHIFMRTNIQNYAK